MPVRTDWSDVAAPDIADLERIASAAWDRLPKTFREACGDVLIQVTEFPTEEVLESLELESEFDVLGLYHGVSLAQKSVHDVPHGPDMVFLYRRPILDYWAEHEETLGHIVAHVLIHEIGHHLGLSDEDMEQIEAEAGA